MSVIYLLSGLLTLAQGQIILPLHPLILDQETPVTLLDAGNEQGPTFYYWVQFNSVICFGTGPSKTTWTAPYTIFVYLVATGVKHRNPLPVTTLQYDSEVGPGMVMYIVWIRLQKFMHKDVEWESVPVLEKHIVAFQVGLAVHTVHDHTVPIPTLKEFFNHSVLYTIQNYWSRKNPASCRVLFKCVLFDQNSELV